MENSTSKLDRIAQWCMVLQIGLLPIFFIPITWITTVQAKSSLIAVILVIATLAWTIARFKEGSVKVPSSLVLAAGLLMPLVYALSVMVSGVGQLSLVGTGVEQDTLAFVFILYAALVLSALIFSGAPRAGIQAIRSLFVGGFLLLVLEIVHFAFPGLNLGGVLAGQTGNAFGNWNEFAILLGLFVVLGIALRNTEAARGMWRYLFDAVSLISVFFLIIANFFDVWTAVGIAGLVAILVQHLASRAQQGNLAPQLGTKRIWIALVVLALFSMLFGAFITNVLPARIRVANIEARPSLQGTIAIGQQSLTEPSSLFFGAGPNTFSREWGLYKPASINQSDYWNTNFTSGVGTIPTSFVTTGIFGIIAWILFALTLILAAVRALLRHSKGEQGNTLASSFGIASAFLFSFYLLYVPGPALSTIAFLSIGLLVAFSADAGFTGTNNVSLRANGWKSMAAIAGLVFFGAATVLACIGISRVLIAEMILNRGVVAYNETQDTEAASRFVSTSLRVFPSNARANRVGVQLGLAQLQQLIAKADPKDEAARAQLQDVLKQTIQYGLDAVAINGTDYQNWLELAGLYQQLAGVKVEGALENARAAYERARTENPLSPLPLLQLAQLELIAENTDKALQNLAAAVELKPDLAAAYYMASQIYASKEDFENAIPAATRAAEFGRTDPLGWYNLGAIAYAGADYTTAAAAEEQALALNPQYANAMYTLGLSYYELKRPADALKVFEALDQLSPDQKVVKDILANLKAGKAPLSASAPASSK
ncbi:MAG: tetratricopeptide repeat protein [Candidatus Kaiserbacteria bacterium]|nr:tetratricopeptide repeat protein [Candidatus Kaiserbacteria bacterium]